MIGYIDYVIFLLRRHVYVPMNIYLCKIISKGSYGSSNIVNQTWLTIFFANEMEGWICIFLNKPSGCHMKKIYGRVFEGWTYSNVDKILDIINRTLVRVGYI